MVYNSVEKIVKVIGIIILVFLAIIFIGWIFEHFFGFILLALLVTVLVIYSGVSQIEEQTNKQEIEDFQKTMRDLKRK